MSNADIACLDRRYFNRHLPTIWWWFPWYDDEPVQLHFEPIEDEQ